MTLFCGRNDEGFQLWPNTQSLESGFFGFRLFWFFVLPVRVLYSSAGTSILLLVGSLPCRNPKCATRKNVPAIYHIHTWHVGYSLAGVQVLVRKGRLKKNWLEALLRNFAGRFHMGQTRRVLSGGPNPELKITATRRQSEKTSFLTFSKYPPIKNKKIKGYRTF